MTCDLCEGECRCVPIKDWPNYLQEALNLNPSPVMRHVVQLAANRMRELEEENKRFREALEQIASGDAESELCSRCMGNGQIYADGKAHYYSEKAPTKACPDCDGAGRIDHLADAIAEAALAAKEKK